MHRDCATASASKCLFRIALLTTIAVGMSVLQTDVGIRAQSQISAMRAVPDDLRNSPTAVDRQRVLHAYARLPLSFEMNHGQTAREVKFLARGGGHTVFLTDRDSVITMPGAAVRTTLVGANRDARAEGVDRLPGSSNYFRGKDPSGWLTGVPHFARVRSSNVYPGIDLVYYGNGQQLKYDFVVAPGADPSPILMQFEGANKVELADTGDVILHTGAGRIVQGKPFVYQLVDGVRREIGARYALRGDRGVAFEIGSYDRSRPLIIDPAVLVYSTFLGGSNNDFGNGIAVDASGAAYVTGGTQSTDFPTTPLAFDTSYNGNGDAFVTKLDPTGSTLVYSTYLGGGNLDEALASAVAVDLAGNAYVTGRTQSSNFPTTALAADSTYNGGDDAFVTQLGPTGGALIYSTYLGGTS